MPAGIGPTATCPCCDSAGPFQKFAAREMMFGMREPFTYLECADCGSLQISEIPRDLARFYPPDYYSMQVAAATVHTPSHTRALAARLLTLPGGRWLATTLRDRYPFLYWAGLGQINQQASILDVGCGAGTLLRRLRRWGYRNLTGLDPYLDAELHEPGFDLYRRELADLPGQFDLVMLHHVLEHLANPRAALQQAVARLAPGGRLLVRLPLAAGPLPREYGADWFNLDAPRHLVIPSRRGLLQCFDRAGLRLVHEEYDSTPLTIFYSEGYRRNVAMRESLPPEAVPDDPAARRRIAHLNAAKEGDYGLFVLMAR